MVVEDAGSHLTDLRPGDVVAAAVRRPGAGVYDSIGIEDMTTNGTYFERGIDLLHGYMSEYCVESAGYLVQIPGGLREVGVLLEPLSIVVKGILRAALKAYLQIAVI